MLALGCIQARRCNTNDCPTGVATSNPELVQGLVPSDKRVRVYNYQKHTVQAFAELLGASGLQHPSQISGQAIHRRVSGTLVKTYQELFAPIEVGSFLRGQVPQELQADFASANADYFYRQESHSPAQVSSPPADKGKSKDKSEQAA